MATFPVEIPPELDSPDLNADVRFGGEVIPAKISIAALLSYYYFKVGLYHTTNKTPLL